MAALAPLAAWCEWRPCCCCCACCALWLCRLRGALAAAEPSVMGKGSTMTAGLCGLCTAAVCLLGITMALCRLCPGLGLRELLERRSRRSTCVLTVAARGMSMLGGPPAGRRSPPDAGTP